MHYFSFRKIFIFVIVLVCILIIKIVDGYFGNSVESYVQNKAYIYTTSLIEQAIREDVVNDLDPTTLIFVDTIDGTENIVVNTKQTNMIMGNVMRKVSKEIEKIEDFNLKLPLGLVFSDTLATMFGPQFNIHIRPMSSVKVDIKSRLTEFGINNTLLEVVLLTEVRFQTIIPFQKKELVVATELPLLIEIISGDIPRYYYQGGNSIPLTPQDNEVIVDN